jgi:hypothetical protein
MEELFLKHNEQAVKESEKNKWEYLRISQGCQSEENKIENVEETQENKIENVEETQEIVEKVQVQSIFEKLEIS